MDKTDKAILKNLQKNARMTISDLSAAISLSMPAASERVRKLETSGVIKQYTVILDPEKINKHLTALMFLRFDSTTNGEAFAEYVKTEPEINECYYITGNFDYYLKIITEDARTLMSLLSRIKNHPGLVTTANVVVLSNIVDNVSVLSD
ncbi:Lrp/AsnC family transcriptional regulator [Pectinatus cerevisiiphilus]|uniref:Lrp/AsnC family leucine-responsive transcriptional regulator n=1 Tax=Pectinatus cerevisiiphilus TaxID=86956 RepID=A0A4R3K5U0_9FIRM|nr:Lrp/AsnC family transcriptional regulator [Pectinatus cerevisiiphilus]TCS78208.1 Lrp/AsnC family leucine-responsive transcriptional regulator [Pectinatus cerevisiiphilus]